MIFIQHFSNCRHRNPSFNHHKRGPQMTLAHVSNKLIVSCLPFRACICWKRLFCPWMNLFRFSIHKSEMRFLEASLSRLDCLTVNKGYFFQKSGYFSMRNIKTISNIVFNFNGKPHSNTFSSSKNQKPSSSNHYVYNRVWSDAIFEYDCCGRKYESFDLIQRAPYDAHTSYYICVSASCRKRWNLIDCTQSTNTTWHMCGRKQHESATQERVRSTF